MSEHLPENPLDPSPEFEARVRERAYHLWQNEGEPVGREADYWERARELEALRMPVGLEANPQVAHPDGPPVAEVVDEAALQDNLGEFPGRFTDQGDERQTPLTRKAARAARASNT